MRFLTFPDTIDWCRSHEVALDEQGQPAEPDATLHRARADMPKSLDRLAWFCQFIDATLQPRDRCLLWVTAWGIWESAENWHLYYRLRRSYGDTRLIEEAPSHLFLDYERPDLVSFLQLGLTAGWDIHLFPTAGHGRAFVSHDGWVAFAMTDAAAAAEIENELGGGA